MIMRKLIAIIAVALCMFTLSAHPKFTMLDFNCGNTPEYTAKFVELDTTKKVSNEHVKYVYSLRSGTWIIEFDDGQKVYASLYNGKIISCGYPKRFLIRYEEEDR